MDTETIYFNKLHPDAIIPKRGTALSAGFDLYAVEDTLIVGGAGNFLVPTGVAVKLPPGTYGRIAMRSGLALNQHLTVSAGVIDRDYTGPIGVLVSSTKFFDINILENFLPNNRSNIPKLEDKNKITESNYGDSTIVQLESKQVLKDTDIKQILTPHTYLIKKGERFAQLVVECVCYAPNVDVVLIENEGVEHIGFGSTGNT